MHHLTSFYTKTNPRENGLFVSEWAVGDKKATHNVKTYAIYFTSPQNPLLQTRIKQQLKGIKKHPDVKLPYHILFRLLLHGA